MTGHEWREQALTLADELERLRLEVLKLRLKGAQLQTPASAAPQKLEGLHGELCAIWLALEERAPELAPLLSRCIERLEGHLRQ